MQKTVGKCIYSTPTHVSANSLPSSGGMYQRTTNVICIQMYGIWFHSVKPYGYIDLVNFICDILVVVNIFCPLGISRIVYIWMQTALAGL